MEARFPRVVYFATGTAPALRIRSAGIRGGGEVEEGLGSRGQGRIRLW